jgi:hypothetical protein
MCAANRVRREILAAGGIGAEIGVHKGGFSRVLLDHARPSRLHLMDAWYLEGEEWTWGAGNRSTIAALVNIIGHYQRELISGQVVLNIGWDLDLLPAFPDGYFDWVYLDTSHQYEQTAKELELLRTKVKATGIISGDDWYASPADPHHGVFKAVNEFIEKSPYILAYADEHDLQWAIRQST